jgi:hypothetical protein
MPGCQPDKHGTIDTDQELARVLVEELKLRITGLESLSAARPNEGSNHVALIFESDTVYGRSLRDTMQRS